MALALGSLLEGCQQAVVGAAMQPGFEPGPGQVHGVADARSASYAEESCGVPNLSRRLTRSCSSVYWELFVTASTL